MSASAGKNKLRVVAGKDKLRAGAEGQDQGRRSENTNTQQTVSVYNRISHLNYKEFIVLRNEIFLYLIVFLLICWIGDLLIFNLMNTIFTRRILMNYSCINDDLTSSARIALLQMAIKREPFQNGKHCCQVR